MRKQKLQDIETSIFIHKNDILQDKNLQLKLIDKESTYGVKLISWEYFSLIIELPLSSLSLKIGNKYTLNFLTSHYTFLANVKLTNSMIKHDSMFYVATLNSPIHQKRSRNYNRITAEIPVAIVVVPPDAKNKDLPPPIIAITQDISAGGLKFMTNHLLLTPSDAYVSFKLYKFKRNLTGKILSNFETTSQGNYVYHMAFKKMNDNTLAKLEKDLVYFIHRS